MKSHAFVMFLPTDLKFGCIWKLLPVNMFLFKSLPQGLFRSEDANSKKLISRCYHAQGHSKISSRSPKNKTKQKQNGDRKQASNLERESEVKI